MAKQRKLSELVKLAKTKPMRFVLVAKGAGTSKLLMNEGRVPPKMIQEAIKAIGGRIVARGVCKGEGSELAFECAQDPPGSLENQLRLAIKNEAALSVNVTTRKSGEEIPDEESEEGAAVVEQDMETGDAIRRMFNEGEESPEPTRPATRAPDAPQRGRPKPMSRAERQEAARQREQEERQRDIINRLIAAEKEMKADLKGKVPQAAYDSLWAIDKATRAALKAKDIEKAYEHVNDLEEKVDVAVLEAGDPAESKRMMTARLDDCRTRLDAIKGKINPAIWKKLDADAKAADKLVATSKWKEATVAHQELFPAIIRAGRAKPKHDDIKDAKGDDAETKAWKAQQRELAKERDRVTGKVKALTARVAKLTDERTAPLKKVTAAMARGLRMRDFSRIEPALAKLEPLVAKAEELQRKKDEEADDEATGEGIRNLFDEEKAEKEALSEEDKEQRARFKAEITALAKRAVELPSEGNRMLRNSIAGLFHLLKSRDWDDVAENIAEMTAKVEEAEAAVAQA